MASIEKFGELADNVTLTTGTGVNVEGTSYDLGKATPGDIGASGKPLYVVIVATAAITLASGSGSIRFYLASDAAAIGSGFSSGATRHSVAQWATSSAEPIPAGTVLMSQPLPEQGPAYERYLGILCEVITTALNGGAINAYLTTCPPKHQHYADGAPALS